MDQQRSNIRISGSGKVAGGLYEEIRISGSGHIEGPCDAVAIHVSGSARFTDSIAAQGAIHCSGSCKVDGDIAMGECHISGSIKANAIKGGKLCVSGSVNAASIDVGDLDISGSASTEGGIRARTIRSSGKITSSGDIEAEEARISGRVEVQGLLNVNDLLVEMSTRSSSYAHEIGGDRVCIRPSNQAGWFSGLFGMGKPAFTTKVIEGNDIELYYTDADVVRGARVRINEGCRIGRVEYTESLHVDPNARVDERQG